MALSSPDKPAVARIYQPSAGTWTLVQSLSPADGLKSPSAASVSGTTIAFGTYTENNDTGVVQIFDKPGATWTLTQTLTGSGWPAAAYFGYSVALDGNLWRSARVTPATPVEPQRRTMGSAGRSAWWETPSWLGRLARTRRALAIWSIARAVSGPRPCVCRSPASPTATSSAGSFAYSGTVAVVMAPNFLGNRGAGFVYEFPVISTAPTLVSLAVTPVNPSVALGLTQQFTATGTYSNGSAQNLTATATGLGNDGHCHHQRHRPGGHCGAGYHRDHGYAGCGEWQHHARHWRACAIVHCGHAAQRLHRRAGQPAVTRPPARSPTAARRISRARSSGPRPLRRLRRSRWAAWRRRSPRAALRSRPPRAQSAGPRRSPVTGPALVSIAVSPLNPTVPLNAQQQFAATGTFANGSTQVLTNVTWSSAQPAVATITAGGLATAATHGTSVITATVGAISGSSTLTTGGGFAYVTNNGARVNAVNGSTGALNQVSSRSGSALSDGGDAEREVPDGPKTVRATFGGFTATGTLTVASPALTSIAITPGDAHHQGGHGAALHGDRHLRRRLDGQYHLHRHLELVLRHGQ